MRGLLIYNFRCCFFDVAIKKVKKEQLQLKIKVVMIKLGDFDKYDIAESGYN